LLTTLQTNIGDDFIRAGLLHAIGRLAGADAVNYVAVNKHEPNTVYPPGHPIRLAYRRGFRPYPKTRLLRRAIEIVLPPFGFSRFDRCDLIVQCGTPVLWHGCRYSEWARPIWRDVLARLARRGVPVLNLGGGSCYPWERQPATLIGDADEDFVRLMLGAARVTTGRDRLMSALCRSLGHDVDPLPCPALPCPAGRAVFCAAGRTDAKSADQLHAWRGSFRVEAEHRCGPLGSGAVEGGLGVATAGLGAVLSCP
jgi:hypothetical protein